MGVVIKLDHARARSGVSSLKTRSISLAAGPVPGGPSVSHRDTVPWSTPKRSAKVVWLSPRLARMARNVSPLIMDPLCTSHSSSQCPMHSDDAQGSDMESANKRLQRAREIARYLTAADAAKAMGVPYATYAGHENGNRGFKREAERYATFFKVDLGWLLTGKGHPKPDSLHGRILSLSPEAQRTIQDMIELLEEREATRRKSS